MYPSVRMYQHHFQLENVVGRTFIHNNNKSNNKIQRYATNDLKMQKTSSAVAVIICNTFSYVLRSTKMEINYSNLQFIRIHLYAEQFNLRIKLSTHNALCLNLVIVRRR